MFNFAEESKNEANMVAINGANDLVRMIRCGETSKVQFKLKLSSQKMIVDEMIAFANSRGGRMDEALFYYQGSGILWQ